MIEVLASSKKEQSGEILGGLCLGRREENTSAYHEITQARTDLEKALEEIRRLKDRPKTKIWRCGSNSIKLSCLRRLRVPLPRCERCFLAYPR
jgi:hypothetical protein